MTAFRAFDPRSFRDPDGALVFDEDRVFRIVKRDIAERLDDVLSRPVIREWIASGKLIGVSRADAASLPTSLRDCPDLVYEHDKVSFVSYAYEWSPAMLAEAATLTLDLCQMLLHENLVLKDATPANVLFRGPRPVFVDILSIVPRAHGSYLWLAGNQFETTFLLPLIANAQVGLPLFCMLQDTYAGITHSQVARLLGVRRWMRPSLISTVALPSALSNSSASSGSTELRRSNDAAAAYILRRTFSRYQRKVQQLARRQTVSFWKGYTSARAHYSAEDLQQKTAFVEQALRETQPRATLDIGANTGEFSALAAQASDVVAIDIDESSAAAIFANAQRRDLSIQALVGNFARPSPGFGWLNRETQGFLERANQRFDLVLMLAVVHHLRTTSGIPVSTLFETVAAITRRHLLVEHVPPTDPMFKQLARGREALYEDCMPAKFRSELSRTFEILRETPLGNGRTLYLAQRRPT